VPPEEVLGKQVTEKADVYSFAMILWELLHSVMPFQYLLFSGVSKSLQKLRLMEISINRLRPPIEDQHDWFGVSDDVWALYTDLMVRCWEQEAELRPSFTEIQKALEHVQHAMDPSPKTPGAH
jgi:hypothetical protein